MAFACSGIGSRAGGSVALPYRPTAVTRLEDLPLEDAGLLGADKGNGAKYLILPPGHKSAAPAGYIPLQSDVFGGFMLFRANFKSRSDADIQASIAYGKRMKVYPLAQAVNPPATVFTDVKDVDFDSTIRYDASYFDHLDRIVQSEPWIARDRAMIDQLKSLGIEKGKPFAPSDATKAILASAAREAGAVLEARYEAGLPPYFSATSRWTFPAMPEVIKAAGEGFTDPDSYPVDSRGLDYSYAFVAIKRLGAGQFYLISIRDKDGDFYDGAKTYRLHVPPNVPVEQYWSVTAYDRKTHALIKNIPRASRSSNATEVKKNNRTGRTRRQRRRRRTVPAQRHALVGMPLDAVGSRGPGRRARHGSDGRDLGDPSPLTR